MLSNLILKNVKINPRERTVVAWAAGTCAALLIVDQITKALIDHNFSLGQKYPIIPGFFDLTYVTNKGAAWGIMQGQVWLLLIIGILVGTAAVLFMRWLTEGWTERYWALFVILSGILGNSIDRVWRGEVVDFLDFYIGKHHWPAFNVADMAICIGLGIYFISIFIRPQEKKAKPEKAEPVNG